MFQIIDFSGDVFYDGPEDVSIGISNITGTGVNRPDKDLTEILNKEWIYIPFTWDKKSYDIVCSESGIVSFEEKEIKNEILNALLEFDGPETPEMCVFVENLNKCFSDNNRTMLWFEPPHIQGVDINLFLSADNRDVCDKFARKIRWKHPEKLTIFYRQTPTFPVNIS